MVSASCSRTWPDPTRIDIARQSPRPASKPIIDYGGVALSTLKWRYVLKLTGFAVVVIFAAFLLVTIESSRRLVAGLTVWDCPLPGRTPADVGLDHYSDVRLQVQPGRFLTAWYVPPQNGAAVLLLQGHWAARDGMLAEAALLARHGYGVMLLDPHPCAGPGTVHTLGQAEVQDVAAAVKFMRQQPDVTGIGVLGFSMGGVIALQSAARLPDIRAVLVQGNFDDLATNITPRVARESPVGALVRFFVLWFYRYYTGSDPALVRPVDSAAAISPRPVFFVAGEAEAEANRTLAQFQAAGRPKELWLVPEVGHGGYLERWPAEYEQRVVGFFDRYLH